MLNLMVKVVLFIINAKKWVSDTVMFLVVYPFLDLINPIYLWKVRIDDPLFGESDLRVSAHNQESALKKATSKYHKIVGEFRNYGRVYRANPWYTPEEA